jgi:hypothetical protein
MSPNLYVSSNGSVVRPELKPIDCLRFTSTRDRLWKAIGVVGLAQAAAVLLVAGLAWRFFIPPRSHEHAKTASVVPSPTVSLGANFIRDSLANVDIEEGHLVVILVDPKNPAVVDRTPRVTVTLDGVDYSYVNLELDWFATYNRAESLGKPDVALKD